MVCHNVVIRQNFLQPDRHVSPGTDLDIFFELQPALRLLQSPHESIPGYWHSFPDRKKAAHSEGHEKAEELMPEVANGIRALDFDAPVWFGKISFLVIT